MASTFGGEFPLLQLLARKRDVGDDITGCEPDKSLTQNWSNSRMRCGYNCDCLWGQETKLFALSWLRLHVHANDDVVVYSKYRHSSLEDN
jgi:hypothetical protein